MGAHKRNGHLTEEGKWSIIHLMKDPRMQENPCAVAKTLDINKKAVEKWWKVYLEYGTVMVPRNRSGKMGQPKKWNRDVNRSLKRIVETKDLCYATDIKKCSRTVLKDVPIRTVNHLLTEILGCSIKKKARCQLLTEEQKKKRIDYSTAHLNDDISKTIYTDESTFELHFSTGKRRCLPGQHPGPSNEVKYPEKVMVWGAVSLCGTFEIIILNENVNAETYIATLDKFFKGFKEAAPGVSLSQIVFQQDGASAHTAKKTQQYLKSKKITLLEHWPPNSPDLSPIEPIWSWMKHEIKKMTLKNRSDLEAAITEVWGRIPRAVVEGVINGYPTRLAECILSDGEKTGHY